MILTLRYLGLQEPALEEGVLSWFHCWSFYFAFMSHVLCFPFYFVTHLCLCFRFLFALPPPCLCTPEVLSVLPHRFPITPHYPLYIYPLCVLSRCQFIVLHSSRPSV